MSIKCFVNCNAAQKLIQFGVQFITMLSQFQNNKRQNSWLYSIHSATLLCYKMFMQHIFLEYSIFINTSGLKRYIFTKMKNKSKDFSFKTLPKFG